MYMSAYILLFHVLIHENYLEIVLIKVHFVSHSISYSCQFSALSLHGLLKNSNMSVNILKMTKTS